MLNQFIGIGRLTKDPESRTVGEKTVVKFTIAIDRRFKNAKGERETDFLYVEAWGKTAENVQKYCGKGRLVAVSGRLQIEKWEKDGQKKSAPKIVADTVDFLDRAKESTEATPKEESPFGPPVDDEDDVPF